MFEVTEEMVYEIAKRYWDRGEKDYWTHESDCRDFDKGLRLPDDDEDSSRPTIDLVREVTDLLDDVVMDLEPLVLNGDEAEVVVFGLYEELRNDLLARPPRTADKDTFADGYTNGLSAALNIVGRYWDAGTGHLSRAMWRDNVEEFKRTFRDNESAERAGTTQVTTSEPHETGGKWFLGGVLIDGPRPTLTTTIEQGVERCARDRTPIEHHQRLMLRCTNCLRWSRLP